MHKLILPFIIVAIFIVGFWTAKDTLSKIHLSQSGTDVTSIVTEKDKCGEECQKEIADQVARAVATLSGTPKTPVVTNNKKPAAPVQTSKPQDSYIQIAGSGSTKNTDWTDVPGTDFSFDVTRDFGSGAHFAWEGFLRVSDANGTAFARIYDVTHKIGVDGSQISVSNVADYTRANSTNMNFWSGRNVYRVQIKSLNTLEVNYMGGKIRISY